MSYNEKEYAINKRNLVPFVEHEKRTSFSERLGIVIGDKSGRAFSKEIGISYSTLHNYLAGVSYPTLDNLITLADKTDTSIEWLATGRTSEIKNIREQYNVELDLEEFVLIPGYQIQISEEYGTFSSDQLEPSRFLAFRRNWLTFRGFDESDLAIVWAKGDSMEPTIHSNDTLVVHLGRNNPRDGHIYIFRNGDELFIKRYQSMLGSWRLISDNSFYSTLDVPKQEQHQFEVVGQVVHIAKDIGD